MGRNGVASKEHLVGHYGGEHARLVDDSDSTIYIVQSVSKELHIHTCCHPCKIGEFYFHFADRRLRLKESDLPKVTW